MNLLEQKHTSQVHLLKLRNVIAVLKKRLSVIVLSCKPVTSKNVIFVDQTQPATHTATQPATQPGNQNFIAYIALRCINAT